MKTTTIKRIMSIILLTSFIIHPISAIAEETTSINTSDYALGLFYPFYDYEGVGMEFAPFTLTLDYETDEDGIYQVSRANAGNTVSYVFQLTDEGIYELAYFPNSYDGEDFRYHEDALDEQVSLYFPQTLAAGDEFKRGYREEQLFTVTDILAEFDIDGTLYQDVIVIESTLPDGQVQRYYYAPGFGEIYSEYIYDDEGNQITTSLSYYGEIPSE